MSDEQAGYEPCGCYDRVAYGGGIHRCKEHSSNAEGPDEVKAAMVRRMNVMHAALVPFVEAAGWDWRSLEQCLEGDTVAEVATNGGGEITVGNLLDARHAISESAYVGPRVATGKGEG